MDKVIDIQDRIPSMREKRRRKTNKKFLFIVAIFLLALLALLYFQSPLSQVQEIRVKGAQLHKTDYYRLVSGIQPGQSYWAFDVEEVQQLLQNIEGVKKVTVNRKWLRDIEIDVQEYKVVAYVQDQTNYKVLLSNGEVFQGKVDQLSIPIINGDLSKEINKRLIKQLVKMNPSVFQQISEITYVGTKDDPNQIIVFMNDGYEVHATIPTFAEKMEYYPDITSQLVGQEKGIIDMEVGTFFKPYSELDRDEQQVDENGEAGEASETKEN